MWQSWRKSSYFFKEIFHLFPVLAFCPCSFFCSMGSEDNALWRSNLFERKHLMTLPMIWWKGKIGLVFLSIGQKCIFLTEMQDIKDLENFLTMSWLRQDGLPLFWRGSYSWEVERHCEVFVCRLRLGGFDLIWKRAVRPCWQSLLRIFTSLLLSYHTAAARRKISTEPTTKTRAPPKYPRVTV